MFLFAAAEYFIYGKRAKGFVPIRVCSILLAVLLIPVLFFAYTGAFGRNIAVLDLLIFYGAVFAAYHFSCKQMREPRERFCTVWANILSVIVLAALLVCFLSFTKNPPHLPLFRDPAGGYGVG